MDPASVPLYLIESLGSPRHHHALFVRNRSDDSSPGSDVNLVGQVYQVTGNIQQGMSHEFKEVPEPTTSIDFQSIQRLGWVSGSDFGRIRDICRSNPPPEKQFDGPRRIDKKKPLRRCQEWTAETIQMLEAQSVLRVDKGPKTAREGPEGDTVGR